MLTAVLDATVIIGLAKGNVFHHLALLYGPLYIPTEVAAEVISQGQGRPGAAELVAAVGDWILSESPSPSGSPALPGVRSGADRAVLSLAKRHQVDHVLSDDWVVVREAGNIGLVCLGTPQIVALMKHHGVLSLVGPVLDLMQHQGFGIEPGVYRQALRSVGE